MSFAISSGIVVLNELDVVVAPAMEYFLMLSYSPPVDDEPDEELDVKSNADPDGNVLYYS
jgi:hypothetical protein